MDGVDGDVTGPSSPIAGISSRFRPRQPRRSDCQGDVRGVSVVDQGLWADADLTSFDNGDHHKKRTDCPTGITSQGSRRAL